ncbi:MAG: hypothetical protein WBK20_00705 [Spirochaetota bacterium]
MNNTLKITLKTEGHCIENAAKEKLQELINTIIIRDEEDFILQSQYELLYEFIHTADFKTLRASDERLAGILPCECEIFKNVEGNIVVRIVEEHNRQ